MRSSKCFASSECDCGCGSNATISGCNMPLKNSSCSKSCICEETRGSSCCSQKYENDAFRSSHHWNSEACCPQKCCPEPDAISADPCLSNSSQNPILQQDINEMELLNYETYSQAPSTCFNWKESDSCQTMPLFFDENGNNKSAASNSSAHTEAWISGQKNESNNNGGIGGSSEQIKKCACGCNSDE